MLRPVLLSKEHRGKELLSVRHDRQFRPLWSEVRSCVGIPNTTKCTQTGMKKSFETISNITQFEVFTVVNT